MPQAAKLLVIATGGHHEPQAKADFVPATYTRQVGTSNAERMDRTHDELINRMSKLLPGQFEELLLRANVAPQYLPAHTTSLMERIVAAIRYLELNGQLDQITGILNIMLCQQEFEVRGSECCELHQKQVVAETDATHQGVHCRGRMRSATLRTETGAKPASTRNQPSSPGSFPNMFAGALGLLPVSVRRVPAVRHALAALVIVSAVAVAMQCLGDPRLALPGIVVGLALMGLMAIVVQVAKLRKQPMRVPAAVFVWCCLALFIVWAFGMTMSAFAGWPLQMSLFGAVQKGSASLLIVPDAEAAAMMPPRDSPFTVSVVGHSVPLAREGVLIGTARDMPDSLHAAYRKHVADGEPVKLAVEYNENIAASVTVRYDGKPCRTQRPGTSGDTLWLIHFDDCN